MGPAGDGVLWRRLSDRPGEEDQRKQLQGGLDCLHLSGGAQGKVTQKQAVNCGPWEREPGQHRHGRLSMKTFIIKHCSIRCYMWSTIEEIHDGA